MFFHRTNERCAIAVFAPPDGGGTTLWATASTSPPTDLFLIPGTNYRPMADRPATVDDRDTRATAGVGGAGLAICLAVGIGYLFLDGRVATLRTVHVWVGTAWTALVLAYGFGVAPLLRERETSAAYAIVRRLVPATVVLLPTLAIVTITAGITMALTYEIVWPMTTLIQTVLGVAVAIAAIALLGVLPTDILAYRELRSANPDPERVVSLGTRTATLLTVQGALQVMMLFLMLRVAAMAG
ncbi:hypothetical protein SAMN05443574_11462 [Haloarcula vallismortis]|uniref:Uncharacterized protein n=2 Tax=Haloarcula vallismortis TaxID=28442 RepID=A0A1H2YXQ5_HALVA|nr:hypothetical protein SAMN05443574_11462 [Haloarcula vallismortis]